MYTRLPAVQPSSCRAAAMASPCARVGVESAFSGSRPHAQALCRASWSQAPLDSTAGRGAVRTVSGRPAKRLNGPGQEDRGLLPGNRPGCGKAPVCSASGNAGICAPDHGIQVPFNSQHIGEHSLWSLDRTASGLIQQPHKTASSERCIRPLLLRQPLRMRQQPLYRRIFSR